MISKELLSEVLDTNVEEFIDDKFAKDGYILFWEWYNKNKNQRQRDINIHELAHKCKEWVLEKRILFQSGYTVPTVQARADIAWAKGLEEPQIKTFIADTEPEAIFKACQWILDNIESKGE